MGGGKGEYHIQNTIAVTDIDISTGDVEEYSIILLDSKASDLLILRRNP
jgi:hypothetical protein